MGKLVITQNASLPWPSTYLTKTVLKTSFVLHDPSDFFKTASFLYSWDFEDGYVLIRSAPPSLGPGGGPAVPRRGPCPVPPSPTHSLALHTFLEHLLGDKLGVRGDPR